MYDYETLSDAITDLRNRGYVHDFNVQPDCLRCGESIRIHPENFDIDEVYRFEGMSNPDDNAVVFAISTKEGLKGILVDAYGLYSDALSPEMLTKLKPHYRG